jgi:glycosyltransferase involved in cell wall biosynthesis
MNNKKVSVLTTLYNHESYIADTLRSAIGQTLVPDEIVVIDDASTDNSVAAAETIVHPAISLIKQEYNLGGATTMKGLAFCTGDYIAILNSDDLWHEDKLRRQIEYMEENPGCGVVFTRVSLIDQDGKTLSPNSHRLHSAFSAENRHRNSWINHFFYHGNAFCVSSALIKRECIEKVGSLNGKYIQLQDFDFWFRAAMAGFDLHVLDENLTYYRVLARSNMSIPTRDNLAIYAMEYSRILKVLWDIDSLQALKAIFPKVQIHPDADDSLTLYYLAMMAKQQPAIHHQLFASDTIFEWSADETATLCAQKCHGFGHKQYAEFVSRNPLRPGYSSTLRYLLIYLVSIILPGFLYRSIHKWNARKSN